MVPIGLLRQNTEDWWFKVPVKVFPTLSEPLGNYRATQYQAHKKKKDKTKSSFKVVFILAKKLINRDIVTAGIVKLITQGFKIWMQDHFPISSQYFLLCSPK